MQTLLFFLFIAHCILAANDLRSTQPGSYGENLPTPEFFAPNNDFLAERPDSAKEKKSGNNNNNGLLALEHLSIEDPDWSRLAGNGDTNNCNSAAQSPVDQNFPQSRFRRSSSRFSKRQNNNDRCTVPESQNLQREAQKEPPTRRPGEVEWPAVPPSGARMRSMNADDLLMLIITQPRSEGKPNPEKCNQNFYKQVPICALIGVGRMRTSHQGVIVPSRFWMETDPCIQSYEDSWCCSSALQVNLGSLRYPAAGFECQSLSAP